METFGVGVGLGDCWAGLDGFLWRFYLFSALQASRIRPSYFDIRP